MKSTPRSVVDPCFALSGFVVGAWQVLPDVSDLLTRGCNAMHARVYVCMFTGCVRMYAHRDRRLSCCGTGSRRVRGCWVLVS